MANSRCVYQQKDTVSIPKNELLEWVVYNDKLGKKDLRIVLFLLTELNGWKPSFYRNNTPDPLNYKIIEKKRIADTLNMDVKDVKKSINTLVEVGILERGDSNSGKNGYRFTF
jgi:hypothetical protein